MLWDSGEVFFDASVAIAYGGQLRSSTQYEWSVTLRDDKDRCHTANSFFETGLLQKSDLEGVSFVCARQEGDGNKPTVFRKTFTLSSKPVSAKLYATALGVYESYINGNRTLPSASSLPVRLPLI